MNAKEKAEKIVAKMYEHDAFSQWLGIELIEHDAGKSKLKMTIRPEMLNGFGIAHGGITFSFADSAFAFASNSHGRMSVSIETSISHLVSLQAGDVIYATAKEVNVSYKTGLYLIDVTKEDGELVAQFKGTVYRKSKEWEIE